MRRFFSSAWQAVSAPFRFITLRDRAAQVEIRKKYGTLEWARRHPNTDHDIDAPKVDANVYIATRAISDAIKSLAVNITDTETIANVEREIDDNDHPANDLLRSPNPEHTWSDIIDHVVKSYLNDGNAILTIERVTGPNEHVEIWPRDPRNVDIKTSNRLYKFGKYTTAQRTYPRNRVIHIRDMSVGDPFWGVGRVNTIREEIMMDYFVNRFNSNFFKYGATLNLMFTPDDNLTEDQHMQILDAMSSEIGGAEKSFKIFINRYAGKFTHPEQKHKDIAFLGLLEHNREKIFGVFGLPPFRGGVMEYANYANALAQDKDFWINTIGPILKVIEDAFNKQLLWPLYGPDVRLRFDLDSVPAIKGDQTAIEDRLLKLKKAGVVSAAYVREQLSIDEDAAPDDSTVVAPVVDDGEEEPQKDEKQEVENALAKVFKAQRLQVLTKIRKLTANGSMMSVLCDPATQQRKIYDTLIAGRSLQNNLQPILRKILMERGVKASEGKGVFDMDHSLIESLMRRTMFHIDDAVDQNAVQLRTVLEDADRFDWSYRQLERHVRRIFSYERSCSVAQITLTDFVDNATIVLTEIEQPADTPLTAVVLAHHNNSISYK